VYVFAGLKRLTGGSVAAAQPVFAALYVVTLGIVFTICIRAQALPPLALPLLCLSKRLHSIYVLRLFNDGVAMLPAFAMVACAQRGQWCVCLMSHTSTGKRCP
jgi:alpha-1,3-mannosyltransferase